MKETATDSVEEKADELVGSTVGDCRIDGVLGSGGAGIVYRGYQLKLERPVAVKVLLRASPVDIQRLMREAQTISSLEHENIVRVFSMGQLDDGMPYLVMELLDGKSLAALMKLVDFHKYVRDFVMQICSALQALHARGITHRDLKPGNIIVCGDESSGFKIKLLDFGIAGKAYAADEVALTATGEMLGTPLYMSPEQCKGSDTDARTDIYALGCIMFELLTGRCPFTAASPLEVLSMHLNSAVEFPASMSADWRAVIERALQKAPEKRFQSAEELGAAVAALAAPKKIVASVSRSLGWAQPLILVATMLVVAIGVALLASSTSKKADDNKAVAAKEEGMYHIREAVRLGGINEYASAYKEASLAVKCDPTNAWAWYHLGKNAEKPAVGIESLTKAIALDADEGDFYVVRAQRRRDAMDFDGALADVKIALSMKGQRKSSVPYEIAAGAFYFKKDYDSCIGEALKALERNRSASGAVMLIALAERAEGRLEKALQAADEAVQLRSGPLSHRHLRGSETDLADSLKLRSELLEALGKDEAAQRDRLEAEKLYAGKL